MGKYLLDKGGRFQLQSRDIIALFGLKQTSPIPKDYTAEITHNGVKLILKKPPVEGRRKHRIFAICPDCRTEVPAGRLHQHTETATCRKLKAKAA